VWTYFCFYNTKLEAIKFAKQVLGSPGQGQEEARSPLEKPLGQF
jgi:hypothetical protein